MKKAHTRTVDADDSDMRTEYDFRGGVRGKHYHAMRDGYTITVRKADGTTEVREVKPRQGAVVLEPDVRPYFPDSESVNATLRALIRLVPARRKSRPTRGVAR